MGFLLAMYIPDPERALFPAFVQLLLIGTLAAALYAYFKPRCGHKTTINAISIGLLATAAAAALLLAIAPMAPDWGTWQQATCMPDHAFSEAIRSGPIRQPANTFSSLAFLFVGVVILALPLRSSSAATRPLVCGNRGLRLSFVVALAVIGLGSAFYHMSMTFVGQTADVLGMYLLSTFIVIYALARADAGSGRRLMAIYVVTNLVLLAALVFTPDLRRYLFAAIVAIGLVLEYRRCTRTPTLDRRLLLTSAGLMGLAFAIWLVDNAKLVFDPYSWMQGHAAWHILGAAAAAVLYTYYEGEAKP